MPIKIDKLYCWHGTGTDIFWGEKSAVGKKDNQKGLISLSTWIFSCVFLPVPLHLAHNKILLRPLPPQQDSPPPPSMDLRFSSYFFLSPLPPHFPPAALPYHTWVLRLTNTRIFFPLFLPPIPWIILFLSSVFSHQIPTEGISFSPSVYTLHWERAAHSTTQTVLTSHNLSPHLPERAQHSIMLTQTLTTLCPCKAFNKYWKNHKYLNQ